MDSFHVRIEDSLLDDLRQRLRRTRWPDQIADSCWDYGADTQFMRELCEYWAESFDWRAQEARLNAHAQARVDLGGYRLHVLHRPSPRNGAIPLLVLHGWPSSFIQMIPLLDALPAAEAHHDVAFDVVVASLPGFGFSDIPDARGMNMQQAGELMIKLMQIMGYDRFAIRASDVGAAIARQIALSRPQALMGLHISGTNPFLPPVLPEDLDAQEQAFVAAARDWQISEAGYAHMHSTRPQTLAHALNDSPAGLAAWIVEKFRAWGDTGDDIHSRFSRDDLLTNITIYWATGTVNSSMRIYLENERNPGRAGRVEVPTSVLMGPRDMLETPRQWVNRAYNVKAWKIADAGGHFMEWEEPQAVANHLCEFFARG